MKPDNDEPEAGLIWVACVYQSWSKVQTNVGLPMAARMEDASVGFLPVYDSRLAARREWPDARVLVLSLPDPEAT